MSGFGWGIERGGEGGDAMFSGGFNNVNSVVVKTWEGTVID